MDESSLDGLAGLVHDPPRDCSKWEPAYDQVGSLLTGAGDDCRAKNDVGVSLPVENARVARSAIEEVFAWRDVEREPAVGARDLPGGRRAAAHLTQGDACARQARARLRVHHGSSHAEQVGALAAKGAR